MTNPIVSFEDVLSALMLEETKPTHSALVRWSERYPQYRDALADFFATWAIQEEQTEPVVVDEDRLAAEGVRRAFENVRRREEAVPDAALEPLPEFDQLVLVAVYLLRGDAWGGSIVEKVSEMSGTQVMFGPVFSALNRLENSGRVVARLAERPNEHKDKPRRYFTVTRSGEYALAEARVTSKAVAGFLADFA